MSNPASEHYIVTETPMTEREQIVAAFDAWWAGLGAGSDLRAKTACRVAFMAGYVDGFDAGIERGRPATVELLALRSRAAILDAVEAGSRP